MLHMYARDFNQAELREGGITAARQWPGTSTVSQRQLMYLPVECLTVPMQVEFCLVLPQVSGLRLWKCCCYSVTKSCLAKKFCDRL